MQAIRTTSKNFGYRADAAAGGIWVEHTAGRRIEDCHREAAEALVVKLGWTDEAYGTLVSGCLPDGSYCHVLTGRDGKGR